MLKTQFFLAFTSSKTSVLKTDLCTLIHCFVLMNSLYAALRQKEEVQVLLILRVLVVFDIKKEMCFLLGQTHKFDCEGGRGWERATQD